MYVQATIIVTLRWPRIGITIDALRKAVDFDRYELVISRSKVAKVWKLTAWLGSWRLA